MRELGMDGGAEVHEVRRESQGSRLGQYPDLVAPGLLEGDRRDVSLLGLE